MKAIVSLKVCPDCGAKAPLGLPMEHDSECWQMAACTLETGEWEIDEEAGERVVKIAPVATLPGGAQIITDIEEVAVEALRVLAGLVSEEERPAYDIDDAGDQFVTTHKEWQIARHEASKVEMSESLSYLVRMKKIELGHRA